MMILVNGLGYQTDDKVKLIVTGRVIDAADNEALPAVMVLIEGTKNGVMTDANGEYEIEVEGGAVLLFRFIGYKTERIQVQDQLNINVSMRTEVTSLDEVVVTAFRIQEKKRALGYSISQPAPSKSDLRTIIRGKAAGLEINGRRHDYIRTDKSTRESYKEIEENTFKSPWKNPYSTFSIDIDAASYSNVRRFINQGQMPPKDAVKIEEMINYFNYDYDGPNGNRPFAVHHEVSAAPWNTKHQLIHIGLQGEKISTENLPASNLVFLIDVSGSMENQLKLPLLKSAFKMLTQQLRAKDRVAIVVYAGAAGEVLPSTSGAEKQKIKDALDGLNAGGSTAGGAGIELAYEIAKKNFIQGGNNRVILATDGDFNIGASSDKAMEDLIERKAKRRCFLNRPGLWNGQLPRIPRWRVLADKGNGNHAYIDNILEAKKVLVNEFGGTLFTIAKDVKLQVEFNPATVQAYQADRL